MKGFFMKETTSTAKLSLSISFKMLAITLLVTNLATLAIWRPWSTSSTSVITRKISVTGEVTLKSVPDEYDLSPYFEFSNADRTKATEELTKQSTDITTKLKALGVKDEQITTNTNAYDKYSYPQPVDANSTNTLQLNYTVKVGTKALAQSVQDYFLTLKPKGQLSPQATFSEAKKKSLETEAREKAIDDAKQKAEKTAKQLGAKLGKVVTISDGNSYGGPIMYGKAVATPMMASTSAGAADVSVTSGSVQVQPGQDDYVYSVQVEYEIK